MRILVLGGTQMLGRDFVGRARQWHSLVLANRGVTRPDLFADLEQIRIDREVLARREVCGVVGCRALGHLGSVDAVVDFSGYTVRHLENTMPFLPKFSRYVFVSTTCVLGLPERIDHSDAFLSYCFNKRECERWLGASGIPYSVVRPCVVVGPHDYTGRFIARNGKYYWKKTGGEAGPGTVHVSDVSRAVMALCEAEPRQEVNLCR